jgi:2-polyprenyl-3-methyl-5-hydroxy-6-metoxy-1,4-benzoquinol methylase
MFIKIGNLKQSDYKGIPEMAAFRLHSDIFEILKPYLKEKLYILDFGCGQGAFSQRLIDLGMVVDACDINTDQLKANVNRTIELDLNKEIPPDKFPDKYDIILAFEILEHLYNPWKYLDDCLKLLKKGGIIVLTTPNISNFISRLRFFMKGSLLAFEKNDLKHGHITPLSFIQIENLCAHFNLEILEKGHVGPIPLIHIYELSRFSILRNTVLPLLYPFMSGPKKGRALIYILRKNE